MNKIYKELGLDSIYKLKTTEGFDDLTSDVSFVFSDHKGGSNEEIYDDEFEKDCPKYGSPLPHILPKVNRIIAIGDIHGDFKLMIDCLEVGKVLKRKSNIKKNEYPLELDNYEWTGKDTIVVQVGDQIDRCRPTVTKCDDPTATPDDEGSDIIILEFMSELHKLAKKEKGAVYSLLGNHEIMNVMGDMNYVSYKGAEQFMKDSEIKNMETNEIYKDGIEIRKEKFDRGNEYAKYLACTRQSVLIIGSNIFVHAAVTKRIAEQFNRENIKDLNIAIRKWLIGELDESVKIKKGKGAFDLGQILTNINVSLFWPRILGHLPPDASKDAKGDEIRDACREHLYDVLEVFDVNNMIVGHTPQFSLNKFDPSGISRACNYRDDSENNYGIWRIDTGASSAFNYLQKIESPDSESEKRELIVDENSKIISATAPQVLEIKNDKEFTVLKMENGNYVEKRFF